MRVSTDGCTSPATPRQTAAAAMMALAMGLLTPELCGLPDRGLILMGDVWLMGDMSADAVVPVKSRLDALELTPVTHKTKTSLLSHTMQFDP